MSWLIGVGVGLGVYYLARHDWYLALGVLAFLTFRLRFR